MKQLRAIYTLLNRVLTLLDDMTLGRAAQRDEKTGLFSAHYFHRRFHQAFMQAKKSRQLLALIILDLDSFKNINDTYGHLSGDGVLSAVGAIIREQLRRQGFAGRFGGDEFTIVLPNTSVEEAGIVAERIRRVVALAEIYMVESFDAIRVTASLGIAQLSISHQAANDLFHEADMALLKAKRRGRNRILFAPNCPCPLNRTMTKVTDESLSVERVERVERVELVELNDEARLIGQNTSWKWILHP